MLHLLGIAHGDALLEPGEHLRRKLLGVAMGKRGGQQGRVDWGLHLWNLSWGEVHRELFKILKDLRR